MDRTLRSSSRLSGTSATTTHSGLGATMTAQSKKSLSRSRSRSSSSSSSSSSDDDDNSASLGAQQRRMRAKEQKALTTSVRENLAATMTSGGVNPTVADADMVDEVDDSEKWFMLRIPPGASALRSSSMFLFSGTNPVRVFMYNLTKHKAFETIIILLIVSNCIFLALDDPTTTVKPSYTFAVEVFYTVAFSLEMLLKMFSLGLFMHKGSYHRDSWNNLDFIIVVFSYLNFLPGFANLTAFRTLRVLRPLRSMNAIKGLRILVVGLLKSVSALVHVLFLAGFIFCIFGILGVQLWMGRFRKRCMDIATGEVKPTQMCNPDAQDNIYWGYKCPEGQRCVDYANPMYGFQHFDDLPSAFLVIFHMCTFEAWTDVLLATFDTFGMISFLYFFILIMIGSYLVPNLTLAVINDKFAQAQRDFEEEERRRFEELEEEERVKRNKGMNLRDIRVNDKIVLPNLREEQGFTGIELGSPASVVRRNTIPELHLQEASFMTSSGPPAFDDDNVEVRDAVSTDVSPTPALQQNAGARAMVSPPRAPPVSGSTSASGFEADDTNRRGSTGIPPALAHHHSQLQHHGSSMNLAGGRKSVSFNVAAATTPSDVAVAGNSESRSNHQTPQQHPLPLAPARHGSFAISATTTPTNHEAVLIQRGDSFEHPDPSLASPTSAPKRMNSKIHIINPNHPEPRPSLIGLLPTGQTVVVDLDEANSFGALPMHAAEGDDAFQMHVDDMTSVEKAMHYFEVFRGHVHNFTEGFPRIISLFLFEQAIIQKRKYHGIEPPQNKHIGKAAQLMKKTNQDVDKAGLPMTAVEAAEAVRDQAPTTIFTQFIVFCIILNTVVLASSHYEQPAWLDQLQSTANSALTAIFAVEMCVKLLALGLRIYVDDPFNVLDGAVVIMSLIELGLAGSSTVSVFRALRLLRVLKLLKNFPSLRQIIRVMLAALSDTGYLNIIMLLYLFIAALVGMQFFGGNFNGLREEYRQRGEELRTNFDSFVYAFFAVFQVLTRDFWVELMFGAMHATSPAAFMYFVGLVLIGDIIILGLFLAILISAFGDEEDEAMSSTEGSMTGRAFDFAAAGNKSLAFHSAAGLGQGDGGPIDPRDVFTINPQMATELRHAQRRVERLQRKRTQGHRSSAANGGGFGDAVHSESEEDDDLNNAGRDIPMLHDDDGDEIIAHAQGLRSVGSGGAFRPTLGSFSQPVPLSFRGLGPSAAAASAAGAPSSRKASMTFVGEDNNQGADGKNAIVIAADDDDERGGGGHQDQQGQVEQQDVICELCGEVMATPLPAPPLIKQRTTEQLHRQHCAFARVRIAKQAILDALRRYIEAQMQEQIPPTQRRIETVLGQAWSCGMLLHTTVDALLEPPTTAPASPTSPGSAAVERCDVGPEAVAEQGHARVSDSRHTWAPTLAAIEDEQMALDLCVGEEQVGRSLVAYAVANIPKVHTTNGGTSLFIFGPKNKFRVFCSQLVSNPWFDRVVLVLIILSSLSMIFDNPLDDPNDVKYVYLEGLDKFFTVAFALEMVLKWVAKGVIFIEGAYFRDPWNYLDGIIVAIAIVSWAFDGIDISFLKVFRTFRALRPLRVINRNRGLKMVVRTLLQSIRGISNVALLSSLNYLIFGILGVQFFSGKLYTCSDPTVVWRDNCTGTFIPGVDLGNVTAPLPGSNFTLGNAPAGLLANLTEERRWRRNSRNFDNILFGVLTMFEVSSGEEWIKVMWAGIDAYSTTHAPVKDHAPYMGFFFIVFYIISNFFLLNMFVGVVIYNFNSVKSHMDGLSLLTEEQRLWVSTQRLMLNFRPVPRMKAANDRVAQAMDRLVRQVYFDVVIAIAILANIAVIGIDHHNMNPTLIDVLEILNYIFVAVFIVEAVIKLVAYRWRYFTSGWNQFDFFLVVLSIFGLVLDSASDTGLPINPGLLRVFRIFRIARILRLIRSARKVRILLETLWYSLPSLGNVGGFMLLIYFIYAVLGIQLFAKVQPGQLLDMRYNNFRSFENAMILLFRFTTVEDWNGIMHDLMVQEPDCSGSGCGNLIAPPIYFVFFLLMTSFVVTNLLIAVVLENFEVTMAIDASDLKMSDLHRFIEIWADVDEDATMMIPSNKFPLLLAKLQPPLGISRTENRFELMRRTSTYRIPEHGGYIHFVEVLIPLARNTMHVALTEREIREHEEMWRATFPNLQSLPILRYRQASVTIDMYFASTYITSAFRRRVAKLLADEMRAERHQKMINFCKARDIDHRPFARKLLDAPSMHISEALRRRLLEPDSPADGCKSRTGNSSTNGSGKSTPFLGPGRGAVSTSRGAAGPSRNGGALSPQEQMPEQRNDLPHVASPPLVVTRGDSTVRPRGLAQGAGGDGPSPTFCDGDIASHDADLRLGKSVSFRNGRQSTTYRAAVDGLAVIPGLPMPMRLKSVIAQPKAFGPDSPNALRRGKTSSPTNNNGAMLANGDRSSPVANPLSAPHHHSGEIQQQLLKLMRADTFMPTDVFEDDGDMESTEGGSPRESTSANAAGAVTLEDLTPTKRLAAPAGQ